MTTENDGIKQCTRCGIVKPVWNFCKDRSKPDGYDTLCSKCRHIVNSNYYKRYRDKILKRRKEDVRRCTSCGKVKRISDFGETFYKKNRVCRDCVNSKRRERYHNKKGKQVMDYSKSKEYRVIYHTPSGNFEDYITANNKSELLEKIDENDLSVYDYVIDEIN